MAQNRRPFSAAEKMRILRLHLIEKKAVSDICDEYKIHPTVFYRWQKALFENGEIALDQSPRRQERTESAKDAEISALKEKLKKKDEVLGEVMEEFVKVKKELGEP